ncbi:hypothetical protein Esti_001777 [Eimeria stiedai]
MMLDTAGSLDPSKSSHDAFYDEAEGPRPQVFAGPGTHYAGYGSDVDSQRAGAEHGTTTTTADPAASRSTVSLGGGSSCHSHTLPSLGGLSGTLDGQKTAAGAKFAVSQLHGVYLTLNRMVLSRCAPWTEFVATASFQRPGTGAAAVDRMERNLRYFSTNYLCICCALGLVCAFLNPIVLLIAAACGALCAFAAVKGEVQVGETVVPKRTFQGVCCLGAGSLLLLLAGNAVMSLLLLCSLVVALHAAIHKGVSYETIAQKQGPPPQDFGV